MRNLLPIFGLVVGVVIGIFMIQHQLIPPASWTVYLGLATMAGLDSVFGGIRSGIEGKFQNLVFVSGLICNVLLAALLAWFGTKVGLRDQVATAIVVVLGGRVFVNLSFIRRYAIDALVKIAAGSRAAAPGDPEVARAEK